MCIILNTYVVESKEEWGKFVASAYIWLQKSEYYGESHVLPLDKREVDML